MVANLPSFSSLPLADGNPPASAWGLYGKDDQLGTLNRLTDEVVLNAAKEIQTGVRISLDWPLDAQNKVPFFGRQPFEKNVYNKAPRCVNDDTWTFNTQSSSQWDGLRHYAYQTERRFYNGVTLEDIFSDDEDNTLGIHHFANKGIVGRGVLVDYHAWRLKHGSDIEYDAFKTVSIPLAHIKAALQEQGTELVHGDILFLRTGYMVAYDEKSQDDIAAMSKVLPPKLGGVEASEEILEWIWSNFSAVAGDQPGFESIPMSKVSERVPCALHEVLLAGWGMPIGELMDLERLAEHCSRTGRYTFFLASKPCNVPGGVARYVDNAVSLKREATSLLTKATDSPPNATAIF